jgi:hypothetical protein
MKFEKLPQNADSGSSGSNAQAHEHVAEQNLFMEKIRATLKIEFGKPTVSEEKKPTTTNTAVDKILHGFSLDELA